MAHIIGQEHQLIQGTIMVEATVEIRDPQGTPEGNRPTRTEDGPTDRLSRIIKRGETRINSRLLKSKKENALKGKGTYQLLIIQAEKGKILKGKSTKSGRESRN